MLPLELWRVSFDERYPIYQQIVQNFLRALVNKQLTPGDRIPSIRDLAVGLKVNTNTIQRAYQELERENLIFSQRGMGYFVINDEGMVDRVRETMVRESTSRFVKEMHTLGFGSEAIVEEVKKVLQEVDGQ